MRACGLYGRLPETYNAGEKNGGWAGVGIAQKRAQDAAEPQG